jgi:hypothetical protein
MTHNLKIRRISKVMVNTREFNPEEAATKEMLEIMLEKYRTEIKPFIEGEEFREVGKMNLAILGASVISLGDGELLNHNRIKSYHHGLNFLASCLNVFEAYRDKRELIGKEYKQFESNLAQLILAMSSGNR